MGQNASDIKNKLQKLDGTFRMNPSQLVDVAFKSIQQGTIEERRCKMKRQVFGSGIGFPEASNWRDKPLLGKEQGLTVRRRNRGKQIALG